ncbi:MAG: cytochrome b, partial [Gammaproteobacteria bacterium]|nr:cytochrome b [Gammaproteobacteria bacterium]
MWRNNPYQWGAVAKTFHWVIAIWILGMFVLGWVMVNWPMSPTKIKLFVWHKSMGLTILSLVLLRLIWRITDIAPDFPANMPPWEQHTARATHILFYLLMIAMPLSGWVINSAANFPLKLYGVVPIPNIAPPDKALQTVAERVHLGLFWT